MDIALIEDEPDCYENYEALLLDRGHNVTVYQYADDAIVGLEEIAKDDVVVLDLMMQLGSLIQPDEGEETGIAIYRRLRKLSLTQPILVLTARSEAELLHNFKSDEKCHYVVKPISDLGEFYAAIEKW